MRATERLAAERTAELEKRTKMVEQRLLIITARLGVLWYEVTGSSRLVPSEIQLTSTGTEMTAEEHVATAETHLRYAEGHLQPSEEHLLDAEVHLKLVKAHLAGLAAMESAETDPPEMAVLPPPALVSGKASAGQAEVAPEERDRSPAARPRAGSAQWGSGSDSKTLHPGAGEYWACPVSKAIKEWGRCECCLTDCRDRKTGSRCYRRIGFRRHHLLRLVSQTRANQAKSGGSQQQQLQGKATEAGRNAPRGRPGQVGGGHGRSQGVPPQRQADMWCFPATEAGGHVVLPRGERG
jgi:hypothetical protein